MSLIADFHKHTLDFRFDAGTSRGVLTQHDSYLIRLRDTSQDAVVGYGECAPLPGLSIDYRPDFENQLTQVCQAFNEPDLELFDWNMSIILHQLISPRLPSIFFGFETAMRDYLSGGKRLIVENGFWQGQTRIPINGLVWMGSPAFMQAQIDDKLAAGYTTLKLKIGALNFEQECALLAGIRARYTPDQITLRVDANGAFHPDEALAKLEQLAQYELHSIEQPIRAGQPDQMAHLCRHSPIPIALDEELIGCMEYVPKLRLLKTIQPQYIILKPTLLGGLTHCDEWIEHAKRLGIGYWLTSALESNIGLNAIAQYAAGLHSALPQGLGTGQLYHNNIDSPLTIEQGELWYDRRKDFGIGGRFADAVGFRM